MKLNPENADLLTTPYWELPLYKKLFLIREILYNSFPNIVAYVVGPIVNIINVYFLSKHGGDEVVAGFGVGLVYCGAFIVALVVTFNQAGNVLMAQAFGAKNNRLCGIYFQRSLILMIGILIPLSFMLIFADKIMSLIPFDEKLVGIAADYVRLSMPSVIGLSCFDIMKSFITSQKVFYPIIYIQLSNLALHYIWVKIFIEGMEMGIEGAALIRNIEDWTVTIMIFVYIKMSGKFKETWIPWTKEAFNKESLWSQVKFSVPIAVMTYFIWFYFELMTMISGTFGAKYVVAHVSVANTSGINYTIGMGISVTVMTYIANSVGKQAITEAKNYFYAGMSILVTLSVFAVTLLISIKDVWASLWTVDSDTQAYLIDVFIVFCLFSLWVDHVNNAQLGLLKAIGRQKIASMMTFVTLYPIGIPLLIFVAFVLELKVIGLWLAFGIANVALFIWGRKKISEVDWDQVMAESKERLNAEQKSGEDVELCELSSSDGNSKRLLEEP